jgi:integrase
MTDMGRRTRGDGSVYYDRDRSCWVGAVEIGRDPQTGRRVRRKVSAPTKEACRDALDELRAEKRASGTVARRDVTVEHVLRDFLANPPRAWRSPITVQVNTEHADRVIAHLGRVKLVKLSAADVERFLGRLAAAGYSASTIGGTKRIGARAVRRAQRDGLAARNVFELAEMPAAGSRRSRAMTRQQAAALLAGDLTPWLRAYVTTGLMLGLRPGELLALSWDDIDFDAGLLHVRGAHLKTPQSRRVLVMPAAVASGLRAQRTAQAADRLRLGAAYAGSGLVLARGDGRPTPRQDAYHRFRGACERAGIGAFHPHELRHSWVSLLSDAGVDIEAIADAAGHSSSTVTREVYRHRIAPELSAAATAMDRIFGAGSAS